MSGQGYHLAIPKEQAKELLDLHDELAVLDTIDSLLGSLEESQPDSLHGGYKDWNLLLLCLTDGDYDPKGGTYPLNQCFFGGKLLVSDGSIVNVVMPDVVTEVASSLGRLSEEWFKSRFSALFATEYPDGISEEEYRAYYDKLQELRAFYAMAAGRGEAVVFYTDDCLSYFFDPSKNPPNRR